MSPSVHSMLDSTERVLDAQGLYCPEPVMMLHNVMRAMQVGETVCVIATDPSTQRDIPKFCQFLGHTLLEATVDKNASTYHYLIQKKDRADAGQSG